MQSNSIILILPSFFKDPFGLITGYLFLLLLHYPFWKLTKAHINHSLSEWAYLAIIHFIIAACICFVFFLLIFLPGLLLMKFIGLYNVKEIPLNIFLYIAFTIHVIAQISMYFQHNIFK